MPNRYAYVDSRKQDTLDAGTTWNAVSCKASGPEVSGNYELDTSYYGIYIGGTRVTDSNRKDIRGDGSAKYYKKGEYGDSLDPYYFGNVRPTLVLNNMTFNGDIYHNDGTQKAQIYIDDDINIVLEGTNTLYNKSVADGIYITTGKYVHFYGSGTLNIAVTYNDCIAIKSKDATITMYQRAFIL